MRSGQIPRRRNRRHVSTFDPSVYEADRLGFLRGLRAIHRAAEQGCDTRGWYLIVEYDRVVGVGGRGAVTSAGAASPGIDLKPSSAGRTSRDDLSGG